MARLRASTETQVMEPGEGAERLSRALPRGALRLLSEHVHSVGELDLLMLLEDDRTRSWGVDEILDALRCPRSWAEPRLDALAAAGVLAEADGRYTCAPSSAEFDEALEAIAHAHRTRLPQLTAVVVSPRRRRALAAVRARRR